MRQEYLAPRSSQLCNLGYFHDRSELQGWVDDPGAMYFQIDSESSSGNLLYSGSYVIRIVATAINCKNSDLLNIALNVGSHVVDGQRQDFSLFDEETLAKVTVKW